MEWREFVNLRVLEVENWSDISLTAGLEDFEECPSLPNLLHIEVPR